MKKQITLLAAIATFSISCEKKFSCCSTLERSAPYNSTYSNCSDQKMTTDEKNDYESNFTYTLEKNLPEPHTETMTTICQ